MITALDRTSSVEPRGLWGTAEPGAAASSLAARLAHLALRSLVREVLLTPKPGLVDRRNNGSHRDMDISTFLGSARAIAPWFVLFFERGWADCAIPPAQFLPLIRGEGLACERDMMRATGGVNTHKGTIFAFGLLCAAAGRLCGKGRPLSREGVCDEVALMCVNVVGELRREGDATTAGEYVFRRYGLTGARGEAASGFATVRRHALPVLDRLRAEGADDSTALHGALLELLTFNQDTNLVARGGLAGLAFMQAQAARLRGDGGVNSPDFRARMETLDDVAIAKNLSPGGSADLLAVTWFLCRLPEAAPAALQHAFAMIRESRRPV